MSYDISLRNPKDLDETIEIDFNHHISGGTYALGGTNDAWLNVTYNYSGHFKRVLGEKGIRTIYGMTVVESIPILIEAAAKLNPNTVTEDYWEPTEGNARKALTDLVKLAELVPPDSVWQGD